MFKWDGTEVTDIINNSRIFEVVCNKITYWKIIYDNEGGNKECNKEDDEEIKEEYEECNERGNNEDKKYIEEICIVRTTAGSVPSILDELKPIFGLPKLGTHWCKNNGKDNKKNKSDKKTEAKYIILIKCNISLEGNVLQEISLRDYMINLGATAENIDIVDNLLQLQVQEIYAFRELLGISKSFDSSIIIRKGKGKNVYPISFYEPGVLQDNGRIIPAIVLETWFEDVGLDDVICKLIGINNINNLTNRVCQIRKEIELIINRIDKENIFMVDSICSKIIQSVQTNL